MRVFIEGWGCKKEGAGIKKKIIFILQGPEKLFTFAARKGAREGSEK